VIRFLKPRAFFSADDFLQVLDFSLWSAAFSCYSRDFLSKDLGACLKLVPLLPAGRTLFNSLFRPPTPSMTISPHPLTIFLGLNEGALERFNGFEFFFDPCVPPIFRWNF